MSRWSAASSQRVLSPGQKARSTGLAALLVGVVVLTLGLMTRAGESDLRDLSKLSRAEAQIVDIDTRRRAPDLYDLAYEVNGQPVTARVPYSGPARVGDRLAVAHVPSDPARVRPVDGWSPGYRRALTAASVLVPLGVVLSGVGEISRRRRGRYEGEGSLPPAIEDPGLGLRMVRTRRVVPAVMTGALLALLFPLLFITPRNGASRSVVTLVVLAFALFLLGVLAVLLWHHGRDGVWVTETELVARRRSTVRRWRWQQVRELGIVVDKGQASVVAARVDDGLEDGIGEDEWVTLARPLLGPVSSHEFARRFGALADERGLPLNEGLHGLDLADTGLARLARRGPGAWPRRKSSPSRASEPEASGR